MTVTGVDDCVDDGDIAYTIVTAAATSADPNYNGLNAADVAVTNIDNDTPGITVDADRGPGHDRGGGTATFTVVLNSQPTADVTIALSSSDTTEGTVAPASLTFTAANWNAPQTVTVTGVDDCVDDGDVAYTIVTAAATSADANYNGIERRRRGGHQHRQRHGRDHRHADQRPDHDRGGRHGHLHRRAGQRSRRPTSPSPDRSTDTTEGTVVAGER